MSNSSDLGEVEATVPEGDDHPNAKRQRPGTTVPCDGHWRMNCGGGEGNLAKGTTFKNCHHKWDDKNPHFWLLISRRK